MIECRRMFLDTAPFIYYLEKSEQYFDVMKELIVGVFNSDTEIATSVLTYEEFCVSVEALGLCVTNM